MTETQRRRSQIDATFVDANLEGAPLDVQSPSGMFRLTIQTYRTGPGSWNYTRGTVTRVRDGAVVADIKRNLSTFLHSFVRKDDREYLITGRAYTSQTIIDLERGIEYEPDGDPYRDSGFCWAACEAAPDGNTLVVNGCVWACPYELRFFDVTDPAHGWPPLPVVGLSVIEDPSDRRTPRWLDARTVECFLCDHDEEPQERIVLRRQGDVMHVIEHSIADAEQERREAERREEAELDAWWTQFSTGDPRYLRLIELVRTRQLPCDHVNRTWDRRLTLGFRRARPYASADLTWDVDAHRLELRPHDVHGDLERGQAFDDSMAGVDAAVLAIAARFR